MTYFHFVYVGQSLWLEVALHVFKYMLSGHEADLVAFVLIQQMCLMCSIWQSFFFDVLLTIHLGIILVINQLNAKNLVL